MKVRMLQQISGTRNGVEWPPIGETVDLPTEELIAGCNWTAVRASVVEHRAEVELRIAQIDAEIRTGSSQSKRLRQQEELASWQENLDVIDHFLGVLDARGL
jgi:hypothetical protein